MKPKWLAMLLLASSSLFITGCAGSYRARYPPRVGLAIRIMTREFQAAIIAASTGVIITCKTSGAIDRNAGTTGEACRIDDEERMDAAGRSAIPALPRPKTI